MNIALHIFIFKASPGEVQTINIPTPSGDHGGADTKMLDVILRGRDSDPLGQSADTKAGGMSAAIGMAANVSMMEKRQVKISELISL